MSESYENEKKEKIDACLNCPLPVNMCYGFGNCYLRKGKIRGNGQLEYEVYALIVEGKKCPQICKTLNIRPNSLYVTMDRLVKNGKITKEQADAAHIYRKKK